ncbi:MAG: hypothetical protein ACO1G7_02235 [Bacteroidota bacterium]|jgi:hypothetical protein|nr:hypothetical protein [Bacteroidia bacterium]HRU60156.1 hypothetical protein [Bacteroidia bacterium]
MRLRFLLAFIPLYVSLLPLKAQEYLSPMHRDWAIQTGGFLSVDTTGFYTSVRPYMACELRNIMPYDSLRQYHGRDARWLSTWFGRKLRKEHLFQVRQDVFRLDIDPIVNLRMGREQEQGRNVFTNTRGVMVQGDYKDKFYFYTRFYENQERFVNYIDSLVRRDSVVPGQGKVKFLESETFDFSQAVGGLGYRLNEHFDFLLATDKNFLGDGYRSLLLSDNAYSYPFFRAQMSFWKFRYAVYYTVLQNMREPHDDNSGYFRKYATIHYLSVNVGRKNRLNLSLFEGVLWKPAAYRGFELHYLNPMLFLRPVENSLDSPDNALLGLNVRWNIHKGHVVYGQLLLDEFLLDEVRAGKGWWGNKQGLQFGYKGFDLFGVPALGFQSEINFVRPFTYQHRTNFQDYTHANQPLAHPLGADFTELLAFANYRWRSFGVEVRFQYAVTGQDTGTSNLGNDIFKSYETRQGEYGNRMYQGLRTNLTAFTGKLTYCINPATGLVLEAGLTQRERSNDDGTQATQLVFFGLRTSLDQHYFDF